MIEVTFHDTPQVRADCPCRVCGATGGQHILTVSSHLGEHRLIECLSCLSHYFDGVDPVIGYHSFVSEAFWLDYVQAGAGITTMLAPLNALDPVPEGDLIDVGCGFGFVVDYWSSNHGSAVGLESSYYGEVGRAKLEVDIRPQMLDAYRHSEPDRQFAVVYSSEVIEHTPDPESFMEDLVSMLDQRSVLVLTTPSTTAIDPASDRARLIAALSPGFHYAMLSEQAMRHMLNRRGLHFRIETHDGQMIVWASRSELPAVAYGRTDWPRYFAFLERYARHKDPHIAGGALARLLKDGLNTGFADVAEAAWNRLLALASEAYGLNLMQADIARLLEIRTPLAELERYPSWLGTVLLFGGILVGHRDNDRRTKLRMVDDALTVLRRRADVDLQFGQEAQSFLPFAERQYVIALSEAMTTSLLASVQMGDHADLSSSLQVLSDVLARARGGDAQ
ncbi:bifunctional 2-polyprenyl-6-hydroxyphenol methylase/3-demethylubiquinol 3-O-methyltransferase UbiG [Rhodobacter sp. SY28-1]|uniref:class I SAM-dependent methyltransferase n=1 Tax=Rhodobacter sp. SY28-1 TaxID=2562317 RepID=UPI0010BF9E83|nr:methyltransferase domain-containing protein [Rhodobacter sp. SY28-1]